MTPCPHLYIATRMFLGDTGHCIGHHRRCLLCSQEQISVLGDEWKTITDAQPIHEAIARFQSILDQSSVTPP